jgi:hypothetical protein
MEKTKKSIIKIFYIPLFLLGCQKLLSQEDITKYDSLCIQSGHKNSKRMSLVDYARGYVRYSVTLFKERNCQAKNAFGRDNSFVKVEESLRLQTDNFSSFEFISDIPQKWKNFKMIFGRRYNGDNESDYNVRKVETNDRDFSVQNKSFFLDDFKYKKWLKKDALWVLYFRRFSMTQKTLHELEERTLRLAFRSGRLFQKEDDGKEIEFYASSFR